MPITWYLIVSALIFSIGAGGVLTRRNPLVVLLCLELMLNASNLALVGTSLSALNSDGAPYESGFGSPAEVGELFLTKFLLAFEIASLLLLIAAVGAVILARRRTGLGDPREISVADVMRVTASDAPPESMLEAGGPPRR